MFNKNSALVKIWVRLLTQEDSIYTIDDIPELSNLKEIIYTLIK